MKLFVDALLIVLLFGYTSCTKAKRNKGEFHRSSSTVIIPSLEQKKIKSKQAISKSIQSHILEPTEIFKKYNSAVFMIYTTDGITMCLRELLLDLKLLNYQMADNVKYLK